MKSAKQRAIKLIDTLADDVTLEDIMEELLFLEIIQERIATADEDEVVSHEEAKRRLSRWLTSSGR